MHWFKRLLTINAIGVTPIWLATFLAFFDFDLSWACLMGWATANAIGCMGILNAVVFGVMKGKGWSVPWASKRGADQVDMIFKRYFPAASVLALGSVFAEYAYGPDAFVAPVLAGLAVAGVILLVRMIREGDAILRGRQLRLVRDVKADAWWLRADGHDGLSWGGVQVPAQPSPLHFIAVGRTGSGKSLLQRLLVQDVFAVKRTETGAWMCRGGPDERALVYDAKLDQLPILAGMKVSVPVKTLHPLDARGVAWDIAADCTSVAVAMQIAEILIPDSDEGANSYFAIAARHLLSGVILAFMRAAADRWTFRDVLLATKDRAILVKLLSLFAETRDRLEHLKEERTAQSVHSTLITKLAAYDPIAAAWSHAKDSVSLKQWKRERMILVLGTDDSARGPLDAINRVLFKRATELSLAQPDSTTRRDWFFFDETREAGKLDGLGNLMTKGRSKGVVAVLGIQSIEGFRAAIGDDRVANELVGQCAHKAILALDSPETAEWAGKVIGEFEENETTETVSGSGRSVTTRKVKREAVLPSEFMSLPPTTPANGLTGYFLAPDLGAFKNRITGEELARTLMPPSATVPGFIARPESEQVLRPWGDADLERLTLTHVLRPDANPTASADPAPGETKSRLQFVGQPEPQLA